MPETFEKYTAPDFDDAMRSILVRNNDHSIAVLTFQWPSDTALIGALDGIASARRSQRLDVFISGVHCLGLGRFLRRRWGVGYARD